MQKVKGKISPAIFCLFRPIFAKPRGIKANGKIFEPPPVVLCFRESFPPPAARARGRFIDGTAFFLNHNRCAFLDRRTGKCRIYDARPLDCRLFPLDIIEEDGEYYWCVFTTCPNWQKMKELLEPFIPLLENKINSSLWRQFCKQIVVTREEYLPYKNRQYVIVKRFAGGFKKL
jgi:Fe-S-cluster containining protein